MLLFKFTTLLPCNWDSDMLGKESVAWEPCPPPVAQLGAGVHSAVGVQENWGKGKGIWELGCGLWKYLKSCACH